MIVTFEAKSREIPMRAFEEALFPVTKTRSAFWTKIPVSQPVDALLSRTSTSVEVNTSTPYAPLSWTPFPRPTAEDELSTRIPSQKLSGVYGIDVFTSTDVEV